MSDTQAEGAGTPSATADAGAKADAGLKTEPQRQQAQPKTYTAEEHAAELQREADRRVNEAVKKVRDEQAALLAAKDKDAETKIKELTERQEEASAKAEFMEIAVAAGIKNINAAYKVAVADDTYIDGRGNFDLKKFKSDNPEFFAPFPNADAGKGAGAVTQGSDMNRFIRAAAGVPS